LIPQMSRSPEPLKWLYVAITYKDNLWEIISKGALFAQSQRHGND